MALTIGSRLAHYDVTALIGEGGMGRVYQATDTKLNRQVALKILPEAFATDVEFAGCFRREALPGQPVESVLAMSSSDATVLRNRLVRVPRRNSVEVWFARTNIRP